MCECIYKIYINTQKDVTFCNEGSESYSRFSPKDWACILQQCSDSPVAAVNVIKGQQRERFQLGKGAGVILITVLPTVFKFHSLYTCGYRKDGKSHVHFAPLIQCCSQNKRKKEYWNLSEVHTCTRNPAPANSPRLFEEYRQARCHCQACIMLLLWWNYAWISTSGEEITA